VNCIKYEDSPRVPRRQGGTVTANVLPVEKKKKKKKGKKRRKKEAQFFPRDAITMGRRPGEISR